MVERKISVPESEISYSGLFDFKELLRVIDRFFYKKGYTAHERMSEEHVYADGKQESVWKMPYKKITDYAKYVMDVRVNVNKMKDVVVEKKGKKVKLQEGELSVSFIGYFELDYEHRWEKKPVFYFLRALFDQFIYKSDIARFEEGLAGEVSELKGIVKNYLNLHS